MTLSLNSSRLNIFLGRLVLFINILFFRIDILTNMKERLVLTSVVNSVAVRSVFKLRETQVVCCHFLRAHSWARWGKEELLS